MRQRRLKISKHHRLSHKPMTAFFVIIPILIVAGAFMWMRPSQRDQHLAKLRSEALASGLKISSLKVPDTSEYGRVKNLKRIITVYEQPLALDKNALKRFTIIRTTADSGVYLPAGWTWDERIELDEADYQFLAGWIADLPASIEAVHLGADSVGVSWDEFDKSIQFADLTAWQNAIATNFNRQSIG